jgi:large subunit ribosomal protein L18
MEHTIKLRTKRRAKRALRVRKWLRGSETKPRLTVFKSNRYVSAQLIDDSKSITLAGISSMMKEFKGAKGKKSKPTARLIGEKIGEIAKSKNITDIVFDRGRYKYHGVIAEVAEGARAAGLRF